MPFLNVLGEKDDIVSPASVGELTKLVGPTEVEELRLDSGHVGLIVGRTAHRRNLPAIAQWLERQGRKVATSRSDMQPPPDARG